MKDIQNHLTVIQGQDAQWCCEQGKILFWDEQGDARQKKYGLELLVKAQTKGNVEATYLIGSFLVNGVLGSLSGSSVEHGLSLISQAANAGWTQARSFLDAFCEHKYVESVGKTGRYEKVEGPLRDFEGKVIKINRTGLLTPIDAELTYENGKNILTLSANVKFLYGENPVNREGYEQAVLDGFMKWQGNYRVFGNQELEVKVHLTREERRYDNVIVIQFGKEYVQMLNDRGKGLETIVNNLKLKDLLVNQRYNIEGDGKWSTTSRKVLYLQDKKGMFDDYDYLTATAKHEFGHALGLGELSYQPEEALSGVKKGQYEEIDSYCIGNRAYNLVMCDPYGPISNNDMEMVVLAFQENKKQYFQVTKSGQKVSEALGKGN